MKHLLLIKNEEKEKDIKWIRMTSRQFGKTRILKGCRDSLTNQRVRFSKVVLISKFILLLFNCYQIPLLEILPQVYKATNSQSALDHQPTRKNQTIQMILFHQLYDYLHKIKQVIFKYFKI